MDLFVYGTLIEPNLVHRLTGKRFNAEPARLPGFRRYQKSGSYAYILACDDGAVHGLLLRDVDEGTLRTLDHYEAEGDLYLRATVVAMTEGGPRACETYIGNPSALDRMGIS